MKHTPHIREFSKNSHYYNKYNIIQKEVAREVIDRLDFEYKNILDLGCGCGAIYENISWKVDRFVGVDLSKEMLECHPKGDNIELIRENFDNILNFNEFDLIVSSSSLQWSKDLQNLIKKVENSQKDFIFAIFTEGTFKNMRKFLNIDKTFLKSFDKICDYFSQNILFEKLEYKLNFETPLEMLRYIKRSGVSGGKKELEIKDIKRFINSYPYNFLEFEVLLAQKL